MAGKTRPTNGTKIDGKYAAAILKTPFFFCSFIIPHQKEESCFQCILNVCDIDDRSSISFRQVSSKPDEASLPVLEFRFLTDLILGKEGIEPSTPRFGSACSAPLSYRPSKEKVLLSGSRGLHLRNRSRFAHASTTRDVDHSFLAN